MGRLLMEKKDLKIYSSPCGIYCIACPKYKDRNSCRGCRLDARHDKCDIYCCCVTVGGYDFCYECDCFPCQRLVDFTGFNPGKNFAHFRHIAIENLERIKEVGLYVWIEEMNKKALFGEYSINTKDTDGRLDQSACKCRSETD
jgi:hypothetical protein